MERSSVIFQDSIRKIIVSRVSFIAGLSILDKKKLLNINAHRFFLTRTISIRAF